MKKHSFYGVHFVKSNMAAIYTSGQMQTLIFWFLGPENVGLAIEINVPSHLEAKIWKNIHFMASIL